MEGNWERGEVDRPAAAVHPACSNAHPSPPPPISNLRGSLVRGAATAQRRATSQQQQQFRTLPATTPLASHAKGGPGGSIVSARACHAFDLYSQCVAAGQRAKLIVEQRQDGEHVSLLSRPMVAAASTAAAPAGARRRKKKRKPNLKRQERLQRRKESISGRQQQEPARHSPSDRQQVLTSRSPATHTSAATAAADISVSLHQQQSLVSTTRATSSYAAVAASPPRLAADNRPPANSSPAVLTRAMKKRKAQSPADSVVIGQLDGAESSPPTSPASPAPSLLSESGVGSPPAPTPPPLALPPGHVGSPSAPTCPTGDGGMGSPTAPMPPRGPPTPPPWSKFLPAYHGQVICKLCLQRSHGLRFQSCNPCFDKGLLSKSKS